MDHPREAAARPSARPSPSPTPPALLRPVGFAGLARPTDLARLPALDGPPARVSGRSGGRGAHGPLIVPGRQRKTRGAGGWRWEGRLVGRALPVDLTMDEYLLLLVDGNRYLRDHPDGRASGGQPVYVLPQRTRRAVDRLLDRLALELVAGDNVACNIGRTSLLNFLASTSATIPGGYTGIQWFEVGTGTNSPASGDTVLQTPFFRKQPASYSITGNQVLANTVFLSGEGNTTYQEAGVYGSATGTLASSSNGTGILFAHTPYIYSKTAAIQLSNNYYITLS